MFIYIHRPCESNGSTFWPFTVWGFPKPVFKPHEYWLCKACCCNSTYRLRYWNWVTSLNNAREEDVVIVLTVYGIETAFFHTSTTNWSCRCNSTYRLRYWNINTAPSNGCVLVSCNSTYRLRYWNKKLLPLSFLSMWSCNSTYRLRYWNWLKLISLST